LGVFFGLIAITTAWHSQKPFSSTPEIIPDSAIDPVKARGNSEDVRVLNFKVILLPGTRRCRKAPFFIKAP
jgi:hypothetical protein